MPRQNRVTPWGEIIAVPDHGMFMGNRGTLHDAHGRLTSQRWTRKAWVICQLSFNDRHRQVMAPGQYTELFFLDEVTALAAGHRPCATCRREDYSRFTQLWAQANAARMGLPNAAIKDIDNTLHQERFVSSGWQEGWRPLLKDLPNGTFVVLDDPNSAWLVWGDSLLEWSPGGYRSRIKRSDDQTVTVLTPRSIVAVLAAGYVPAVHPSAGVTPARKVKQPKTVVPTHMPPDARKSVFSKPAPSKPATKPSSAKTVKPPAAVTKPVAEGSLFKLRKTPAGKALYTYTAAILRVTGMDQGKVYPLKKFLGNFSGHVNAGRIQKVSGGFQLTRAGIDYFNDRYNPGNRQHVNRSEVEAMSRLIRSGGAPDWIHVE
jgi:hypothetical protein